MLTFATEYDIISAVRLKEVFDMDIRYAVVKQNKTDFCEIHKTNYQEDGQVIPIYDLLDMDTDCFEIAVYGDYVAFACMDIYCENWYFVVFKLNNEIYNKRLAESKLGYHQGMFWLLDDIFDSVSENDALPTFEQMLKGLKKQ